MPYSILEESGETRRVGFAREGKYALELNVARPEYLRDEDISPFYFNIFKKDEEDDDFMEFLTPFDGVPVKNVKDFKKLVKRHGKRLGIPSVTFNSLRAKIELDDIGRWKDLDDPKEYFLRTETDKQKADRELIDGVYEKMKAKRPDATYRQINAALLRAMAKHLQLPTEIPPFMPDYSQEDRKLTMGEIMDDMENREITTGAPARIAKRAIAEIFERL